MTTPDPKKDLADWIQSLPQNRRLYVASRFEAGKSVGFAEGSDYAKKQISRNRYLIPLAMVALAAGVLGQRYLHLIN